ncbi:zinc finger protein 24-like isoform X2 [Rana temporaria]|uniref:zinc finger protein 24-like isoform X2 n=1 Tax=Rana temporaria TaxID=8407 RepID=UPI001AAD8FD9|nr:zinc finger protein 24-like isoform X2 [Rana temporaria]
MPNCIVAGCTSKQNKPNTMKGVILHVFPPDLERIKTWLLQTGQDFGDLDEFAQKVLDGKRTDAYRLCSAHFTLQCYHDRASKKALRANAVPTIFHNKEATSQQKCTKKNKRSTTSANGTDIYRKTKEASTQTCPLLGTKTAKSLRSKSHIVTDSHKMDEIRKTFTEKIFDLTLGIVYLLIGEDFAVVKTSGECVTSHTYPHMSGGRSSTQSPTMEILPPSPTPERNYEKILEVTNQIIDLLTGEGENLVKVKIEVKSEHEEPYVMGDEVCISEEIPPEIGTDPGDTRTTQRDIKVKEEEEVHVWIKEEEVPMEIGTGEKYNMETNSVSLPNDETDDDDVTDDSSDENPIAPNSNAEFHSTHRYPDPPTHGTSFSDHSYPIPHHVDRRGGEAVLSAENGRPPHTCPLCAKGFPDKFLLRKHEKTHKGEMPYYCPECGKDYLHKSRFISHRRIHTGEKPYSCSKCGKSFANKPDLVRHHRMHTGEKPFSCSDCGKRFAQRVHLLSHQKKHALEKQ